MKDANTIIEESVSQREEVYSHLRAAADFFHEHEGTFFERGEAIAQLSDELSIEQDIAGQVIAELVGDIVDPVVLSAVNGEKYVGVVEFEEFDGAYGYVDYHDVRGPDKRVVCQQCVNEASLDTQVAHATAGDPSGTVSSGADYDELLDIVHEHYANSHEVVPEDVATGATLASGTTIGGNVSWHAGNDGSGSGLDADNIRGTDASTFASNAAPVQSVNSNTGDVVVQTGAQVQDGEPTNAQEGDLWVDTSETPPVTKWYDGSSFSSVIQIVGGTRHRSIGTQSVSETETFGSNSIRTLVADVTYSSDKDNIETISAFFDFSNTAGSVWEYEDGPKIFYADGTTQTITGYAGTRLTDYNSYPIELPLLENKKLDKVYFDIFNNGTSTLDQTVILDIESSFSAVDSSPHTHEIP